MEDTSRKTGEVLERLAQQQENFNTSIDKLTDAILTLAKRSRYAIAFTRFGGSELTEFIDEANKLLESGEKNRTSIAQACEKFYKVTEYIDNIRNLTAWFDRRKSKI